MKLSESAVTRIGWFASCMSIIMFSSYIDQIRLNLEGNTGSIILPIATMVNCVSWTSYALLKEKKDWPLLVCNSLGIVFSAATAITAVI